MGYMLDAVPCGYYLYAYDDCGIEGRQPHVRMDDCYLWTFNTSDTDADLKSRSAVFSYKKINAVYENLNPQLDYVVAVTYANDHVYNRVQSMWADGIELHGPYALPKAKAVRLICKIPPEATSDGKVTLEWRIHGEVNATVSIIELWASSPPPGPSIRFGSIFGTQTELIGKILNLSYDGIEGVNVKLTSADKPSIVLETTTGVDGSFSFDRQQVERLEGDVRITANFEGSKIEKVLASKDLFFDPIHFRPIPVKVGGLKSNHLLLDGTWRINPNPPEDKRPLPMDSTLWGDVKVPGQWLQQGYDIPQDKPVAMALEFVIPQEWAGHRIFLRFDAVHAGTDYWLNGRYLGYSENLFTPVEWEITKFAHVGMTNRLDLRMIVATVSEALSYSSGYAFHNLGGIDRSVHLFALPAVHIRSLHLNTDLDKDYKDADLKLAFSLDGAPNHAGMALNILLFSPQGKQINHSLPKLDLVPGQTDFEVATHVKNPLKWSAEKPNLYRLVLELMDGENLVERIERSVGFRKIEWHDKQLFINGKRIKLAGACHHEVDPLTGRADTMRHAEEDVRLLKAANLNYIRTSHYPSTNELLDAADRLGMYVEVEAPFCWVGPRDDMECLRQILVPTSAMVDYCHAHPSVIIWSLANESHFNEFFEVSNKLIKHLDPTRPTTFNNPDPKEICDIENYHYPPMPWHEQFKDRSRPILFGEYWFPVCHEQTDVMINPGLREYFGRGHADPDSKFAREIAAEYDLPVMKPCAKPGAWSGIYHSEHIVGGAIWASHDDAFYFPDGKHCGYAWHHGFWGLIDVWRRPKPEWYLARLIFSPVCFPASRVDYIPGEESVCVPVENRYSFTNLSELKVTWEVCGKSGIIKASIPPSSIGNIEIPIPKGTPMGESVILRAWDKNGNLVNARSIQLGEIEQKPLPRSKAGPPKWQDDGKTIVVWGRGFSLVLDRTLGDFAVNDKRHDAPITAFPSIHLTRYDFGDLAGPNSPPYAVFPDSKTRVVEEVSAEETQEGLKLTVRDRYEGFAGWTSWLVDKEGMGRITYDYIYLGDGMNMRELGAKLLLKPECDEIRWRRWSEWGNVFPEDCILRPEGSARARRDSRWGEEAWNKKPAWPWSLDQTEFGTADFRSVKFNIYEASLESPDRKGIKVHANADVHVRPALSKDGVWMHILSQCRLGQVLLKKGDRLSGEYVVEIVK